MWLAEIGEKEKNIKSAQPKKGQDWPACEPRDLFVSPS